jgi:hypothetical protein
MGTKYKVMYRVQCKTCGAKFTVPTIITHVPKHPPLGSWIRTDMPWDPCTGSGVQGKLLETIYPTVSAGSPIEEDDD